MATHTTEAAWDAPAAEDAAHDDLPMQDPMGNIHARALLVGAIVGGLVAAFFAGSVMLLLILGLGAAAGAVCAAIGALARDQIRERRTPAATPAE